MTKLSPETLAQLKAISDSRTKNLARWLVLAAVCGGLALVAGVSPGMSVVAGIVGATCAWASVAAVFIPLGLLALAAKEGE